MNGYIEIKKISITELSTDVIVNAANEGLWAGSGVCGAIFQAAGYNELQEACNKIGHCDVGSAVITPGFRMKSKYIIHAVGPRWSDGKHGEPEHLYGAYSASLKLAVQYGCSSIGFPLISAGIFGYPVDQAWSVALKACRDFLEVGNQINIVFAVLDDQILNMGSMILNGLESISQKSKETESINQIIGLHSVTDPYGCFSNWFHSEFTYAGMNYNCVEQYMMFQKVSLGHRYDLQQEIMHTVDPERIKALGGKEYFTEFPSVKPIWEKHRKHIVKRGVRAKFMQNPEMLDVLLKTESSLLAECAGQDKIWGIGINLYNAEWNDVANWSGSNYLGQILMEIREELRREKTEKGFVQYIDFRNAASIPEWKMTVLQLKRFPQFYDAIHTYADQLPVGYLRDFFYKQSFEQVDYQMNTNMGGGLPISGFYEMKQEIYEIARRLRNQRFVSDIFYERPASWGLRGHPYFWKTLEERFAFDDISMTEEQLKEKISQVFKEKTGTDLAEDSIYYVEEYAYGGMSSGRLSGEWIVHKCIPMLQERLRMLKNNCQ